MTFRFYLNSNLQDVDKIEEKRCIQEDQCEIQNLSDSKSPKIDKINEILVEKLLKTSVYKSRREIILKYGYSDFAIWFQEESFFNYWQVSQK